MSFWGIELKPRKPYTLRFSDFQAPRLHLSQATLGNAKSDDRTIVRCTVAESPLVYLCSLRPGHAETCSINLFFDEDVTFSVKGSSSVHLAGYFDGVFDGNEPGEDVESDGYSDEGEEEDSDNDSMDGFIVSTDEDYDDADNDDDDDDDDWVYEEDDTRVPNTGVIIEELPSEETELPNGKLVPFKKIAQDSERKARTILCRTSDEEQENVTSSTLAQSKQAIVSSEDEDGFCITHKRKRNLEAATDLVGNEKQEEESKAAAGQPVPHMSGEDMDNPSFVHTKKHKKAGSNIHGKEILSHLPEEASKLKPTVVVEHDSDPDSKKSTKKKRKKKKKLKESLEGLSAVTVPEVNGLTSTPSNETLPERQELEKDALENLDSRKNLVKRKHPNGLEIENIQMGKPDGKQASPGKKIGMIYTGRLKSNGKIFDSNVGKKPFFFRLGVGEVIQGWDIGVNGMRVGDKRHLIIPPQMGYGSKGVPGIPPNSWLKFDVELVEVK